MHRKGRPRFIEKFIYKQDVCGPVAHFVVTPFVTRGRNDIRNIEVWDVKEKKNGGGVEVLVLSSQ